MLLYSFQVFIVLKHLCLSGISTRISIKNRKICEKFWILLGFDWINR